EHPRAAIRLPDPRVRELGALQRFTLTREPALLPQELRHDFVLELAVKALEQAVLGGGRPAGGARETVRQHEPRQSVSQQKLLVPTRRLGSSCELDPVDPGPWQGRHLRELANRRDRRSAHVLEWYAASIAAEIQLVRLRRALRVRHAEQDLVFVAAHVRE